MISTMLLPWRAASGHTGSTSACRWLLLAAVLLSGCGRTVCGYVDGRVTLDGKPLPEATVEFQPDSGSPSYGETDAQGRYELALTPNQKGAVLGKHTIRVSTFRIVPKEDGSREEIPERVPSSHNIDSKLTHEVRAGSQTVNIAIETSAATADQQSAEQDAAQQAESSS